MILHIPNVLNEQQVAHCRDVMEHATWVDGRVTAGYQSASVKDNRHSCPRIAKRPMSWAI